MKRIPSLSFILFLTGVLFKFSNVHYNAVLITLGLLGMLVVNIDAILKKANHITILQGFTTTSWFVAWLFTVKYWPFNQWVVGIAVVFTLILIAKMIQQKTKVQSI